MLCFFYFSIHNIFVTQDQVTISFFIDTRHFSFYKLNSHILCLSIKFIKTFSEGTDVQIIKGDVGHGQCAHEQLCLFYGIHATNLRADGVSHTTVA